MLLAASMPSPSMACCCWRRHGGRGSVAAPAAEAGSMARSMHAAPQWRPCVPVRPPFMRHPAWSAAPPRACPRLRWQPPSAAAAVTPKRASSSSSSSSPSPSRSTPRSSSPTMRLPAVQWGRSKAPKPQKQQQAPSPNPDPSDPDDLPWGFWDPKRLEYAWPVPWGFGTLAGGMLLWLAGIDIYELSSPDKAVFTFACQLAETVVTLALIRLLTAKSLDEAPKDAQATLFNYSFSQPFARPRGWAIWAMFGSALAPLLVGTVAELLSLTGYEESVGGRGTVDGVASMISIDLPTYLSLLSVTGVMAPVLEETVFRGFLLTSLTKYLPTWAAIPSSALLFGLAHLSPKDFPVLFSLGCLLGMLYVRSRNLLTPILVHGAWNSVVLTLLFVLASYGINVEEFVGASYE